MNKLFEHLIVSALVAAFIVAPAATRSTDRANTAQAGDRDEYGMFTNPRCGESASRDNSGTNGALQNNRAPQLTANKGVAEHGSLDTERRGFEPRKRV